MLRNIPVIAALVLTVSSVGPVYAMTTEQAEQSWQYTLNYCQGDTNCYYYYAEQLCEQALQDMEWASDYYSNNPGSYAYQYYVGQAMGAQLMCYFAYDLVFA